MNHKHRQALTIGGLLALGAISGFFGARIGLDARIAYVFAKEQSPMAVNLALTRDGTPFTTDGSCTTGQTFNPSEKEEESYLETKIGFIYRISDNEDLFGPNTTRRFEVVKGVFDGAQEELALSYDTRAGSSYVTITDEDRDMLPDRIYLRDDFNNTEARITRTDSDTLTYTMIDEKTARQIYDLYAQEYRAFKIENRIDERIAKYQQKLEILQVDAKN